MVLYLSTVSFHTGTNRIDGTKRAQHTCTHTRLCTYTHVSETEAETFPTATRRATNAHPARGRHTQHPPARAEGLCNMCRQAVTQAQSPARGQTHLHTSPLLVPLHTQRFWSSSPAPAHDALLRLKLYSSWKWKGCTGERRSGAGKGFLVICCSGIFFLMIFYFFWQTRIPFELIHFFLSRISNDNA